MNPRDTDKISFIIRDDPYGFRQGILDATVLPSFDALLTAGQDWTIKLWKFDYVCFYMFLFMCTFFLGVRSSSSLLQNLYRSLWTCQCCNSA